MGSASVEQWEVGPRGSFPALLPCAHSVLSDSRVGGSFLAGQRLSEVRRNRGGRDEKGLTARTLVIQLLGSVCSRATQFIGVKSSLSPCQVTRE